MHHPTAPSPMTSAFVLSIGVGAPNRSARAAPWRCTATQPKAASVGKAVDGGVTAAPGFRATGVTAGLKPSGAADLAVVVAEDGPAVAAGVFTTNMVCAAPVTVTKEHLAATGGRALAVVINSGQANAATGDGGHQDALATATAAAAHLGCGREEVLLCSTGVIGVRPNIDVLQRALPGALDAAKSGVGAASDAARAIMTTDLVSKEAAYECDGVVVGGMCKGSGMIHPNMATLLGMVTCNAAVAPDRWSALVRAAAAASFNCITVDGDTSTNDTILALASGRVQAPEATVAALLDQTMCDLARKVARDGEGATVLVEVRVSGATSEAAARTVARTIASSSLVKAAVHGRDPNWGRIAAAAGRSGVAFDERALGVAVGPHQLLRTGQPLPFDAAAASRYLADKAAAPPRAYCSSDDTVVISVSIGDGDGEGVAWGCDLSYDYVRINAEYTT